MDQNSRDVTEAYEILTDPQKKAAFAIWICCFLTKMQGGGPGGGSGFWIWLLI